MTETPVMLVGKEFLPTIVLQGEKLAMDIVAGDDFTEPFEGLHQRTLILELRIASMASIRFLLERPAMTRRVTRGAAL